MKIFPKLLIIIFLFALFLRLFRLDTFPLGFHVDEAKVAWESLSILKTLHDDHGNLFALHYNSFGDYRPTGIFYAVIPSLILFGRTNFAVRFIPALLGALTVFPLYFLTLQLTKKKAFAFTAAFLLTILPWHIAPSRATSEVVISCFLILTALCLLIKKPLLSFTLLTSSFFFYHSARVMGPILMLVWLIYFWQKIAAKKKIVIGFLLTSFLSLLLILSPAGRGRYNQVKLETPSIRHLAIDYFSYFDPSFFIGDIAKPFRYTTRDVGIVSLPIFLLFLFGVFTIVKSNKNKISLLLLALGPIPAALTLEDSPNLHRAFFMLPFFIVIASIGLISIKENHKTLYKFLLISLLFTFITFARNYLDLTNNSAFQYRDPQTKMLSLFIAENQKNYDRIFVANDPDSPYPWFAFFTNLDPKIVNTNLQKNYDGKWQMDNIIWDNTKCPAATAFAETKKDLSLKKVMVIDNGGCFTDHAKNHPEVQIIREFSYLGKVNYRVWEYVPTR